MLRRRMMASLMSKRNEVALTISSTGRILTHRQTKRKNLPAKQEKNRFLLV
jgi:hypothetical protein